MSTMSPSTLEKLVWVLIYGGIVLASLGYFVQRQDDAVGWTMIVLGGMATVAGAVLVWVRSRWQR